jgi:ethanolamine utilization cobalamin adenosyltransferase
MLTNLFDVIRNIIENTRLHMVINMEHLFHLLKLHKMMHNNNRYFDSTHDKKFQFFPQLIERYRQMLTTRESTYHKFNFIKLKPKPLSQEWEH